MSGLRPLAFALLLPCSAAAQLTVQEYLIPRAAAFPHDPAVAADGTVWYTDQQNSYIGRLNPDTGVIVDYPTPTPGSGPHGITIGPDGYVWYTGQRTGRIGRVDPSNGSIREFPLPANANQPHTPIWHQGAVWFTAQGNQTYGRLDPVTGNAQVWNAPASSNPYGIVPGPDGYLWIALFATNRLGRVDPANGSLQLFTLPNTGARPRRIAVSNDGYVWYTDFQRGYLGRLDPATSQVVEWLVPDPPPGPYGISLGTDSKVWFHAQGQNQMFGFDPKTQMFAMAPIPTGGAIVRHMVTDYPRGRLWLALSGTQRIGKVQLVVPVTFSGTACAGSLGPPSFTSTGSPRIGERITFDVGNTAAGVAALFLGLSDTSWGPVPLPFDLTPHGAAGCFINASWDALLGAGAPGPLPVDVPVDAELAGGVAFLQWALLGDPSGKTVVTTQRAKVTLIGL